MSKTITNCLLDFVNDLDKNGYSIEEMTIELPYNIRTRLAYEMYEISTNSYRSDRHRGVSTFVLNTRMCPVKINSLQSERDEVLKAELEHIRKREQEIKEMLGGR